MFSAEEIVVHPSKDHNQNECCDHHKTNGGNALCLFPDFQKNALDKLFRMTFFLFCMMAFFNVAGVHRALMDPHQLGDAILQRRKACCRLFDVSPCGVVELQKM